MTIRERAIPQQGLAGLGTAVPRHVLTSGVSPLRQDTERALLHSEAQEAGRLEAWSTVARASVAMARAGTTLEADFRPRIDWIEQARELVQPTAAPLDGDEPFLHVIIRAPALGELHLSDIDRPVGTARDQVQLEGRVLELGAVSRRFAESRGLAQSVTSIRLRNDDRALDRLLLDPATGFLQAEVHVRVGFRTLPPALYRPVGAGWSISRVSEVDADSVVLELQDLATQELGVVREPPLLWEARMRIGEAIRSTLVEKGWEGARDTHPDHSLLESRLLESIPIGREPIAPVLLAERKPKVRLWVEPVFRWAAFLVGHARDQYRAAARLDLTDADGEFLEESRKRLETDVWRDWGVFDWIGAPDRPPEVWATLRRVIIYDSDPYAEGRPAWYAWILIAGYTATWDPNPASAEYQAHLDRTLAWWDSRMADPQSKRVRLPHATAGPSASQAWEGRLDPASAAQYIAHWYLDPSPLGRLDPEDMAEIREEYDGSRAMHDSFSGNLEPGTTGADLLDSIGRSWALDWWWSNEGRIRCRPAHVTKKDLLERIPAARVYDARWDILRGSWSERVPLASERWGYATQLRFTGGREIYSEKEQEGTGATWNRYGPVQGRALEAEVHLTWWFPVAPAYPAAQLQVSSTFHHVVTFRAPLHALELELGDYLRVTHWAGVTEEGGYRDRLLRVEGLTLDWAGHQVEVQAVDMGWIEEANPGVLDDESHWVRLQREQPDGRHMVLATQDARLVRLEGPDFLRAGIRPGDFLVAVEPYAQESYRIAAVAAQDDGLLVTLEESWDRGSCETWRVERSHLDPPDDPARYPAGARFYTRLADEETGTFRDGSPAYRLQD